MARSKTLEKPLRIRLRRDDLVEVIAGRDRGKRGRVLKVDRRRGRVWVEGVMLVKRHTGATRRADQGRHRRAEASIHVSNVMLVCPSVRAGARIGTRWRKWAARRGGPAFAASAARRWTRRLEKWLPG
jgi:large subunit ribosomal protein L24